MIDAHQHCWQIGAHGCIWPTADLAAIYRDFSVADLQAEAQPLAVKGSVLVQSQPCDADTDYLLSLAREQDFVKAVVGWVDLAASDAPARIASLAAQPKLRSLRPMLQSLPDDDWILRPELVPAIAAMLEHKLCFDALVFPRHLPFLCEFAARYPDLPIVIDHAAKPFIAAHDSTQFQTWSNDISALAALPQVYCKVSGLLTEAGAEQNDEALQYYVDHLLAAFSARRLMWGSDWPVVKLAPNRSLASYTAWFAQARRLLKGLSEAETNAVFEHNAGRFYGFELNDCC